MICIHNGQGCSKEDNCVMTEEERIKNCAVSKYLDYCNEFYLTLSEETKLRLGIK